MIIFTMYQEGTVSKSLREIRGLCNSGMKILNWVLSQTAENSIQVDYGDGIMMKWDG